jgi:hypothetical protein
MVAPGTDVRALAILKLKLNQDKIFIRISNKLYS